MSRDWLLLETLGGEPVVVADGARSQKLVPVSTFLRRSPHLSAIQTAVAETVNTATSLVSITPKGNRVIRTEPVRMTDGTVHGVHVWVGAAAAEPPARVMPGPLLWNLTTGIATDTPQSLRNSGLNPDTGVAANRAFTDDITARNMSSRESEVLARAAEAEPGTTYCATWKVDDWRGEPIAVGFVTRVGLEPAGGGREHVIARAMNWRSQSG
ncbi:hypothetical protein MCHIJ_18510 [Mycolicibacterium chitae]|uniref:Rv3651-like N-terminal domain-containing protein n=1 Tax=Mycolicibacterium chitae TaxID=1792 RepID=A0A3S4RIM0_MYCCI|nr:PAS domain-containing protein [Mycolicibacterium chitae]MCV7107242.1 DUF5593 domain-containing protein [Mycolicibacterium chitae]BBZ02414.1 hypothetical protein MCHIJ_18510 [Mycolicibacterium chitae]VEG44953.1 Uncharacterised protein [Mycolicibacterium chitae]